MRRLTEEQVRLLEKFGFRNHENDLMIHKKLDVQLNLHELHEFETLEALESYIKDKLRNS